MHFEEWINNGEWSTHPMYTGGEDNYYGAKTYDAFGNLSLGSVETIIRVCKEMTEAQKYLAGINIIIRNDPDAEVQGDIEEFWVGVYSVSSKKMTRKELDVLEYCGWGKDDYYDCWNFKLKGGDLDG